MHLLVDEHLLITYASPSAAETFGPVVGLNVRQALSEMTGHDWEPELRDALRAGLVRRRYWDTAIGEVATPWPAYTFTLTPVTTGGRVTHVLVGAEPVESRLASIKSAARMAVQERPPQPALL